MFEVVSLQRHSERTNGGRGRLQSPTEEEEPEEGQSCTLSFGWCGYLGQWLNHG